MIFLSGLESAGDHKQSWTDRNGVPTAGLLRTSAFKRYCHKHTLKWKDSPLIYLGDEQGPPQSVTEDSSNFTPYFEVFLDLPFLLNQKYMLELAQLKKHVWT